MTIVAHTTAYNYLNFDYYLPTYTNRNQIKLMIIMIIKLNGEAKILLLIIFYIIITRNPFDCNVLYP